MKYQNLIFLAIVLFFISCTDDNNPNLISGEGIFTTQSDDATIEGELFLPDAQGPFPVLIIVPGSGNDTREFSAAFAPIITSFGYGLYVYDKRGLGGSTGSYPAESFDNPFEFLSARADDVIGIIDFLQKHVDIKTDKIGLFGSSQGTWVSTITYDKKSQDIGLMIMLSGGVTSTKAEQHYEDLIEISNLSIVDANQAIHEYMGDLGYDPKPTISNMDLPTLFIYGGKDDSHPTLYDKEIVETLNRTNFTIHFYENATHDLEEVGTNNLTSDLLTNLGAWLMANN